MAHKWGTSGAQVRQVCKWQKSVNSTTSKWGKWAVVPPLCSQCDIRCLQSPPCFWCCSGSKPRSLLCSPGCTQNSAGGTKLTSDANAVEEEQNKPGQLTALLTAEVANTRELLAFRKFGCAQCFSTGPGCPQGHHVPATLGSPFLQQNQRQRFL